MDFYRNQGPDYKFTIKEEGNLDFNTIKNSIVNTTVTQKRIEILQKAQKAKKK